MKSAVPAVFGNNSLDRTIQYASAFANIVSSEKGKAVPYQDTIPVTPGDYSDWTFVVTPQFAEIKEG